MKRKGGGGHERERKEKGKWGKKISQKQHNGVHESVVKRAGECRPHVKNEKENGKRGPSMTPRGVEKSIWTDSGPKLNEAAVGVHRRAKRGGQKKNAPKVRRRNFSESFEKHKELSVFVRIRPAKEKKMGQ